MRRFVISMLLALTASVAGARQVADTLSMDTLPPLTKRQEAYIRRLERYHKFWRSLTPDFLRLQYAGSIGLINMGWGWAYARERRFETDIMLGFVPSYDKEDPFFTFTLRQSYMPWRLPIGTKGFGCQPLSCGFFFNSVLRSDYWTENLSDIPIAVIISSPPRSAYTCLWDSGTLTIYHRNAVCLHVTSVPCGS